MLSIVPELFVNPSVSQCVAKWSSSHKGANSDHSCNPGSV